MGNEAKVSVIVALYNSASYLKDAVASVQAQTMPDWQLLLVDDASTDTTVEIAEKLAEDDKRITVLRHAENRGSPAFGRNTGLAAARSEFVTFLDHDDTFYPFKLERMLEEIEAQGVDFLCSNIDLVNATTAKVDGQAWADIRGDVRNHFAKRLLKGNFVPPNSTLIRRSVFELVGMFDTSLKGVDDYDMWYRIARVFPSGVVRESLASWRYRNASSISADDTKMIIDEKAFYEKILTTDRAFAGADPRGAWTDAERLQAGEGIRRAGIQLANRHLLAGVFKEAAAQYAQAGAHRYALLTRRMGPLFRMAYQLKRRAGASQEFKPLVLDFSV